MAASIVCVVIALICMCVTMLPNLAHQRLWKTASGVFGFLPVLVLQPWWHWRKRDLRHLAKRVDGRLCPHCAYDISTLDPIGTCPECGGTYDIARDAPLWRKFADPKAPRDATPPPDNT